MILSGQGSFVRPPNVTARMDVPSATSETATLVTTPDPEITRLETLFVKISDSLQRLERHSNEYVKQTFDYLATLRASEIEFANELVKKFSEDLLRLEYVQKEEEQLTKFLNNLREMKEEKARWLNPIHNTASTPTSE